MWGIFLKWEFYRWLTEQGFMDNIGGGGWYFLYYYLQLKQVFRNMDLKAAFQLALN